MLALDECRFMQYYLAAKLDYYAINEGCSGSQTHACRGAAAVYRVSLSTALFFAVLACATYAQPSLHDAGWGGKIFWWVALTGATFAIPNFVFDDHGYVWLARVGAYARRADQSGSLDRLIERETTRETGT